MRNYLFTIGLFLLAATVTPHAQGNCISFTRQPVADSKCRPTSGFTVTLSSPAAAEFPVSTKRKHFEETLFDSAFLQGLPLSGSEQLQIKAPALTQLARSTEQRHAVNFAMHTSEALFTDRVYYPLVAYRQHLFGGEAPQQKAK